MLRTRPESIFKKSACALGVALAIGASHSVYAQAVPAVQVQEEVVVSASRIQRGGFEAPTPTTVIGSEEIQARAASRLGQMLFEIPAMRPTATAVPFSANAGGNYANLRSLNPGAPTQTATRTLVLVDGRRFVPTTTTGLVDTNVVPTALVERVEVVTGGASAAWGSDAVAGVTNFIFKKKMEGFEGSVQYGQSEHNDQKEKSANLAWGTSYADGRGQVMVAAEYSSLYDIAKVGNRSWGNDQWGWVTGPLNGVTVTRIKTSGVVTSGVTYGGVIVAASGAPLPTTGPTSALRGIQFGPGGAVQPFIYGTNLSSNLMVGGSGTTLSYLANLSAPVDRKNLFARTTFEFTSRLRGFAEASYAMSESIVNTQPSYTPNGDPVLTIQRDNAFLPASVRNTMVANNLTSFGLGRVNPEFGTYSVGASKNEVKRFAAGLDGELGENWMWKAYATKGKTEYYDKALNNIKQANLRAAVDTVLGPGGTPICRINSTLAADIAIVSAAGYQGRGAEPGCVAANPFGPNSFSPAVAAYVVGTSYTLADIEQTAGGASIQGEPFSTWAGPVSVAGGVEYRKESVSQTADPLAQFTTPAFQTGGWQFANRRPLEGSYTVREYFAETVVPLAKSMAWAHSLDLNAAVRSTDYSTSGKVTSWKVGMTYSPVKGVLIRGTKSRDIRAANLVELYTQGTSIVGAVFDYGRPGNPSLSVPTTTLGNPDLKPERADTQTIGVTWEPAQIRGLHTSVDVYKIDLVDAIGSLGGQNIVSACYGVAPFTAPLASACALISRDSTGAITNIANRNLNLAFTKTNGMDIELGYRFPLNAVFAQAPGNLSLRILGTWIDDLITNNGISTVDRAGEIGNSHWRWTGSATYTNGPLTLYGQVRYIEPALVDNTFGPTDIDDNNISSRTYVNGSVQYTVHDSPKKGKVQLFFSVNNLFDKDPPIVPSATAGAGQVPLAPDYDKIGRYYTVGLRFSY